MSNTIETKSKVAMGQKIAFGLGMLANQMFPAAKLRFSWLDVGYHLLFS
jgi:hypothetical protein